MVQLQNKVVTYVMFVYLFDQDALQIAYVAGAKQVRTKTKRATLTSRRGATGHHHPLDHAPLHHPLATPVLPSLHRGAKHHATGFVAACSFPQLHVVGG